MKTGRTRLAFLLAAVLAAGAAVILRRPSSSPPAASLVPEVARATGKGRPVIFVGLDGGDWELFDRYIASGAMPNLARLVREGAGGTLLSLHLQLSPLVWTTMMTGVGPLEHGILDFTRFRPGDHREEPITSDERRVPAVWNMATYGGKRVGVLGLWATFPAERVNGLLVSDRLFPFLFKEEGSAPGLVHPEDRLAWARKARAREESAVGLPEMRGYLPWLSEEEYRGRGLGSDPYAHPVSALRRILIETRLFHALGTEWIRREEPDLAVVYVQGTDSIGHVFAPFAPPRQPSVTEEDYGRYHRVPELYFRFVDQLLGEYEKLAAARRAVLVLASDHGFRWSEGRPVRLSSFAGATAATWHRPEGMYLLWGQGIPAAPGHPHRGRVDQIAATLLALLDLPPRSGDAPLPGVAASTRPPIDYAAFYRPAPAMATSSGEEGNEEALEKLRALGYVGGASGSSRPGGASTRTAGSHANESMILRLQGRGEEAVAAAEKALAIESNQATALWCLSDLVQSRQPDRSDELLVRAYAHGLPQGIHYVAARAERYQRSRQGQRATRLLDAAVAALPEDTEAWRVRGRFRVDLGDCAAARSDLERAAQLDPGDRTAQAALGLVRLCLGDETGAREALARAGASAGEAHRALGASALVRGDLARAEKEAGRARKAGSVVAAAILLAQVELRRNRPAQALQTLEEARASASAPAPMNLELLRGEALAHLGRAPEAEAAFREEIRAHPAGTVAYERLAVVLALQRRPREEIRGLFRSLYEARPLPETAALAARNLLSLGDAEEASLWRPRAEAGPLAPSR